MKTDVGSLFVNVNHAECFRGNLAKKMSVLLANQNRTNLFSEAINHMIVKLHAEMISDLEALSYLDEPHATPIKNTKNKHKRLSRSLDFSFKEHRKQWQYNSDYLKGIVKEVGQVFNYLSDTLVERDLFEQQNSMLEQIVLSDEKIKNWKEFAQEVLSRFHAIFQFNIFFIVFEEDHGIQLYIYFFGCYSKELKRAVKQKLSDDIKAHLSFQKKDIAIDIEEYEVQSVGASVKFEDIRFITVNIPGHSAKSASLLGLAHASAEPLSDQLHNMIRSLLSVVVMAVGSSKQLSHTLQELEYYSGHDPLTGLYNRRFFTEMLEYEVALAERHAHKFCILMLDLDNFKDINDSYGHPTGDNTLVLIADLLRSKLRKGDIATRVGGDEFAIILPETPRREALEVAEKLRESLHELNFKSADGKSYRVTASIGLASFPRHGKTPADLMAGADVALYHAKDLGKNGVSSKAAKHHVKLTRSDRLCAEEIREALKEDRMLPFYQPIINCKTGEVFANEALARMKKTDGSVASAGSFIEVVEKYGLSRDLDKVILTHALTASRDHMRETGNPARIFLNLSPQEIQERGILSFAESLCRELSLPSSSVVFEILERDAIKDLSLMGKFLENLRKKGFSFALDDFGSGYNSFHYLRELHFEYVKIDGAFVRNILNSRVDRVLVHNLSHLCKDLGIMTIAEFVESKDALEVLQEIGIDYAQGYSLAMPESELSFKAFPVKRSNARIVQVAETSLHPSAYKKHLNKAALRVKS